MTYKHYDRRVVKPLPRRDVLAAARAQAQREAEEQAALALEARQRTRYTSRRQVADDIADELDAGGDDWEEPQMPIVTRRYDLAPDGLPLRRASRVDHYHEEPYFTRAPAADTNIPAPVKQRLKVHWAVYVGGFLIAMLIGYMLLTNIGAWWQAHTDDTTYGMPRTYQTDAVVGHSDSNSNPSHFQAENLKGHIIVIELPGGDISKSRVYNITSEINGNPYPPATVSFRDINGDGKLDMVVVVGDPGNQTTYTLYNDGTQFTSKP